MKVQINMILNYDKFTFDIIIPKVFCCDKLEELEVFALSDKLFILDELSIRFLFCGQEYVIYDFENKLYKIDVYIKKGINVKESNIKEVQNYINNSLYMDGDSKKESWNLKLLYNMLKILKNKKNFILNEEGYRYKILEC